MKKCLFLVLIVLSLNAQSANFISTQNGDWADGATWGNQSLGVAGTDYPGAGDGVTINGHHITYNVTGQVAYNSLTLNGSGSLDLNTANAVLEVTSQISVNFPITLGSNTVMLVGGDVNLNSGGTITMTDQTSIFRVEDKGSTELTINSALSISNGIFALQGNSNNILTVNGSGSITITAQGAMYFESNNLNAVINAPILVKERGSIVNNTSNNNKVTINGSGSIIFEYGSTYYRMQGKKDIDFQGAGRPQWQVAFSNSAGWRHIGSPLLTGTTWNDYSATDMKANVTSGQENVYYWDASGAKGANAPGWQPVSAQTEAFAAGNDARAFAIYCGDANYPFANSGVSSIEKAASYADSYDFTIYNTKDPGTNGDEEGEQGWNLIPNPYPAWLDLEDVLTTGMASSYQGAHIWNATTGQYRAYLVSGASIDNGHDNTGAAVTTVTDRYIRPFQAFWVKMATSEGASKTLTIDESYRQLIPGVAVPSYFKTSATSKIRLNTFAQTDSAWDQALVVINPMANASLENDKDAFDRAAAAGIPNMHFITDGERLAIDSRPLNSLNVIPMAFTQGVDQEVYSISLDPRAYDYTMDVILEDVKTGAMTNMENASYSFTHDIAYPGARFKLHLSPSTISIDELKAENIQMQTWVASNQLRVVLADEYLGENITIEVFDISGKLLESFNSTVESKDFSQTLSKFDGITFIKVSHLKAGTQVVKTIQ